MESKERRIIERLMSTCHKWGEALDSRKILARQFEDYTQMLLREGRTTKEELKQYFPKKRKITNDTE